jgi:single-strand DNA-binding protein
MNQVRLVGTLANKPALRYTPAGLAVLDITLAGDDRIVDNDGVLRQIPWYHRVTLFGAAAERYEHAAVSTALLIEGRLDFRSWENEAGDKRNWLGIVGLRVEIVDISDRGLDAVTTDSKGQPRLADAINEVTIIGNLTRDADTTTTTNGNVVVGFGVALNERFRAQGAAADTARTHYVEVRAWNDVGSRHTSIKKGTAVWIGGRLVTENWEDKDGNRRYATRVEASRIEKLTFPAKAA